MAIVVCPECKKHVSQYAELCPECGFPIKSFMEKYNLDDIENIIICPKCANIYFGYKREGVPLNIKCQYCNSTVIKTLEDTDELFKLRIFKATKDEFEEKSIQLAKLYGNNQFSQEEYEKRLHDTEESIIKNREKRELRKQQSQQQNTPQCPKCGSTAIEATQKGYSLLTGFIGSGKTMNYCKNCGHKWKLGK